MNTTRSLHCFAAAALAGYFAMGPRQVQAQTLTTLHSFTGGADGAIMFRGATRDAAGNLYGMTFYGANLCADSYSFPGFSNAGCGTIWKLDTSNVLTTLTTFAGAANGANPDGNLTIHAGRLYGDTWAGGAANQGMLFSVKPNGGNFVALHSFNGGDGQHPDSTPRFDAAGNLYSIAAYGGPGFTGADDTGGGVLFQVTAGGAYVVEHNFSGGADGALPVRIFLDAAGLVFGATTLGGACTGAGLPAAGCGTLYRFDPATNAFQTIYAFSGGNDGYAPRLAGVDAAGDVWGVTRNGGALGFGTIFKLKPNGLGGYAYRHLHDFNGASEGAYPTTPAFVAGAFIGGTEQGQQTPPAGAGVLYKFKAGVFSTLFTFVNDAKGGYPFGTPVVTSAGDIFGTTGYGGIAPCNSSASTLISTFGCGTIYRYGP